MCEDFLASARIGDYLMRHAGILQGTPEWHARRLENVGSSEVASLFGVQEAYAASAFTLHQVKSRKMAPQPVDDSPGGRIWMGRHMEPIIASMAKELYRWPVLEYPGPWCTDDVQPGMSASLDGIIEPGPEEAALGFYGPGLLETKFIQWLAYRKSWTNGEPPYQTILQAQHGCACAGLGWGCVVVLVGEMGLQVYRYRAREHTISLIRDRVKDFWDGVKADRPPDPDHTASSAAALKEMFPGNEGLPPLWFDDEDSDTLAAAFLIAQANKQESNRVYELQRNLLLWKLKGHTAAESFNHWIDANVDKRGAVRMSVREKVRT